MPSDEFQNNVLHELGEIKGLQRSMYDQMPLIQADLKSVKEDATRALDSAKSAHHRLNFVYAVMGAFGMALLGKLLSWY